MKYKNWDKRIEFCKKTWYYVGGMGIIYISYYYSHNELFYFIAGITMFASSIFMKIIGELNDTKH